MRPRLEPDLGHRLGVPSYVLGPVMSLAAVENFLQNARAQISQRDINESYLRALTEMSREIKRLEDEIRRVQRDVRVGRRFG